MSIFIDRETRIIVKGITGKEERVPGATAQGGGAGSGAKEGKERKAEQGTDPQGLYPGDRGERARIGSVRREAVAGRGGEGDGREGWGAGVQV